MSGVDIHEVLGVRGPALGIANSSFSQPRHETEGLTLLEAARLRDRPW